MKFFTFDRSKAKPEDFYFYAARDMYGDISVIINPIKYWNERGYVYDQHLSIYHILPDYMSEVQESHFGTNKSLRKTRADLRALGFKENEAFSKFCKEHDPF